LREGGQGDDPQRERGEEWDGCRFHGSGWLVWVRSPAGVAPAAGSSDPFTVVNAAKAGDTRYFF
jgi:hypothetical protein